MSMIQVRHVSKVFGKNPHKALELVNQGVDKVELLNQHQHALGLHDINLQIEEGEVFVIMGLSGSGKSTLIRHFNRLIEPTAGNIIVAGEDVTKLSRKDLKEFRRHSMSMVFQHFGLIPHRTVLDNAAYALRIRGVKKPEALQQGKQWLERVGLAGFEGQYPQQLSGGQQQRVGLARALAADTSIILMDEAFSALDPLIRTQMQDELLTLQKQLHKTVVFITHDLAEALRIGSRIAILNEGKLAQIGTPEDILLNPADDYVRKFVQGVNLANALTVESIMRPPSLSLESTSLQEAQAMMKKNNTQWLWLKNNGVYKGLVTLEALKQALQDGHNASLADIAQNYDSVDVSSSIESAVPVAISADYPIPVTDKDGKLTGVLDGEEISKLYDEQVAHSE